ncbi:hypothetical protein BD410DRAFT_603295 [Rickenella mellea]|uniref:Uncharacterized protein n=1 Tax=Rickenella mellea TaxID=50990 RepID=A0A4Y7QE23_9AGAM|nr:hypothetical protein BD410DRAFT_603295 [Rickenella mellea]
MPSAKYERLPASPADAPPEYDEDNDNEAYPSKPHRVVHDPRFDIPTPAPWKRAALIIFVLSLFWLAFRMQRVRLDDRQQVIHASRYSKDHKFRPAASPVVTERLKDGKVRLRGGHPAML